MGTVPSEEPYPGEEVERVDVGEDTFLGVLAEATGSLEKASIEYGLMGGIASAVFGRPRWTLDVDIFLRSQDAAKAQEVLAAAGFEPRPSQHNWLLKCVKDRVLVDLIFTAKGGIYFDEQMQSRIRPVDHHGVTLRVVPPEDLVVMKAIASDQDTPRYWHDALGIIAASELDWDYLVQRARIGPRRVLSLLLHAQADDMIVPDNVIRAIYRAVYENAAAERPLTVHGDAPHLTAHLRERFAEDPRVNELNIETAFEQENLILRGRVSTPERREAVAAVAA
ncbi:MAG: nucleotidyltransferase family protein, partial [Candidatus Dormibacteraeota bacterium]|nr:nucleotidyltransferase family protein [Candidatus Dormibacteraeota bacterium]